MDGDVDMKDGFGIVLRDGVVCVRLTRRLTLEEEFDLLVRVAKIDESRNRIWVLHEDVSFTSEEIVRIARRARELWPPPGKVAWVAEQDLGFGLMRMMDAWRSEEGYETAVFRTEEEAWAWFGVDPQPATGAT